MQIIYSQSNSPTFNLAAEEFLFSERKDDLLFLYVNKPSVIVGSNQVIQNEVDQDYCVQNNIQVVRRISGGGTVYHDLGNLNYCFISNKIEGKSSLNIDFLNPIVHVLRNLGLPVEIGVRKDLWLPGPYKISGTASHISKKRDLHHGTLLFDTDLEKLEKALTAKEKNLNLKGIPSVPSSVKNIKTYFTEQLSMNCEMSAFKELFIKNIADFYSSKLTILNETDISKIKSIESMKYTLREWTFRK